MFDACRKVVMCSVLAAAAFSPTSACAAEADGAAPRIEFDFSKTPDLEKVARQAEAEMVRWYPRAEKFLATPDGRRPEAVRVVFDPKMKGVAAASGDRILVSAKYLRDHPDDLGMFIHEMTHVI